MRLADKVVLITGATGGIGAATVRRFASEGAILALTDIRPAPDGGAGLPGEHAGASRFWPADLTSESEVRELTGHVIEAFGRIDILVNIAGGDFGQGAPFEKVDSDNFYRNIDANLKSAFLTCQSVVPHMQAQGAGSIVNMSSLTYRGSSANQFAYSASKGGVYALTRTLAMTLGKSGIRVNAVAPGMIEVDTITRALPPGVWEQVRDSVAATYPLGRVGQPVDVANCILFLASDEAAFITGEVVEISGGGRL